MDIRRYHSIFLEYFSKRDRDGVKENENKKKKENKSASPQG